MIFYVKIEVFEKTWLWIDIYIIKLFLFYNVKKIHRCFTSLWMETVEWILLTR